MENKTLDMQALFNPKSGMAPFTKTQQGKSLAGSLQPQCASFISVLDNKTVEAINNQAETKKNPEESDQKAMNPASAAIPMPDPVLPGGAHQIKESASLSDTKKKKSLPLSDHVASAAEAIDTLPSAMTDRLWNNPSLCCIEEIHPRHLSDHVASVAEAMPSLDSLSLGMTDESRKHSPNSGIDNMKPLPMSAALSADLSTFPFKAKGDPKGDMEKTVPRPAELSNQAKMVLLKDPVDGMGTSSLLGISELIQSQLGENASAADALSIKKQGHQAATYVEDETGYTLKIFDHSSLSQLSSASGTEEKASCEIDLSTPNTTLELAGMRNMSHATSDIPYTTESRGPLDKAKKHTIENEASHKILTSTVADASLSKMDPSSGDHATNQTQSKNASARLEEESGNKDSVLRQINDKPAVDKLFTDLHRTPASHRDNRTDTTGQKEAGILPTATQKPIEPVNDGAVAVESSQSRKTAQVELSDHAVFMKSSTERTASDEQDAHQGLNVMPTRHDRNKNQYELPLHAVTNIISTGSENRPAQSDGSIGINTQAVIDQIQNARQSMNSGFGRVRMTLDPPNLGTVSLEIVVRKEWVGVVMTADNSNVQQALQSRVDDIRTALQRQDLKIENFQILLQNNSANQQQGYSGAAFGQQHERETGQNQTEKSDPVKPLIRPLDESRRAMGLVSIFV